MIRDLIAGPLAENVMLMNGAGGAPNKLATFLPQVSGLVAKRKSLRKEFASHAKELKASGIDPNPILDSMDASISAASALWDARTRSPEELHAAGGEANLLSKANGELANALHGVARQLNGEVVEPPAPDSWPGRR